MATKEEMMAAIRECAGELGHCPNLAELKKMRHLGLRQVKHFFRSYSHALREAGFSPYGQGYAATVDDLFRDWTRVARHVGKIPTLAEYNEHGHYSVGPFLTRFGGWTEVPRGLLLFARENFAEAEDEWRDVIEMLERHGERHSGAWDSAKPRAPATDPIYGAPLIGEASGALAHAPTNEIGVVYMFGMLARKLGFVVTRLQPEFPDCELLREVEENQWQRLRAEFEFESRNFLTHRHDPAECDLIVCWVHNWPECPLEVVELSAVGIGRSGDRAIEG